MVIHYIPVLFMAAAGTAYEEGVAARLDGQFETAAAIFEAALDSDPRNADLLVQYGLTLSALGRHDEAETALRTALEIAPDYQDARIGLARLAFYQSDFDGARAWLSAVDETDETRALRDQISRAEAAAPLRWQAGLTYEHSQLSLGLPDWTDTTVFGVRRHADQSALSAQLQYVDRFGTEDIYGEIGFSQPFGTTGVFMIGAGASIDPDFRPEWALMTGVETSLYRDPSAGHAVRLDVDLVQARYGTGDVTTLKAGPRLVSGSGAYTFGLTGILLNDETGEVQTGLAGALGVRLSDSVTLLGNAASAPETAEGFTVDVETLSAGLRWSVSDTLTLTGVVLDEDRGAYDRKALTLSLDRRF